MNRTLNRELLRKLVEQKGTPVTVSYEADVGHSTLQRLLAGTYPSQPRKKLREKLAHYFRVEEDVLFPPASGNRVAS